MAGGLLWGAVLRLWMRFVAERPEFSWSGTLLILTVSTLAGSVLGVLWWRHLVGASRWWKLLGFGVLPVFGGAGLVMLPSAVVGAVGIGRIGWPRGVRISVVIVAIGAQFALFGAEAESVPAGRLIPALVWYTGMIAIQMWAISVIFRPRRELAPLVRT